MFSMSSREQQSVFQATHVWWKDAVRRDGAASAWRQLAVALWQFARDSTPQSKRSRYGDADYDWEHRVNTTSGGVGWRERLLGTLHSLYQPTEPTLFHAMIAHWIERSGENLREFVFCDFGSGKGRALLMASDYPFRRIVGVELLPALHQIAEENIRAYKSDAQKCFALETICADATTVPLPEEPLLLYLFNPFPEAAMRLVIANLEQNLKQHRYAVYVLYHNPLLEHVLAQKAGLKKIGGTHQYSMLTRRSTRTE
jgi:hypothetical protein